MAKTFLEKIQQEFEVNKFRARTRQAHDWYIQRLKNISNINRNNILNDPLFNVSKKPTIGSLCMFFYEAKHAETLPYWDRFPVSFIVQPAENGFYGINLHYLEPSVRALLLSRLYTVASNRRFDESTKITASYEILKGTQKFRQFKPCFKRYLYDQVRSPYAIVPASEWALSVFIPSEMFVGETKESVWKKSRDMI